MKESKDQDEELKESKDQDKKNQRIKTRRIKGSNEEKSEKRNQMIKMRIGTKDKTPEQTTQPKITPNKQEKGK